MAQKIGQKGLLTVTFRTGEKLQFEVIIKDVRESFGRTDYLVTPLAGGGEVWKSNVKLI